MSYCTSRNFRALLKLEALAARMPGKVKAGDKDYDIVGGGDLMATFAPSPASSCRRMTSKGNRRSLAATICRPYSSAPASARAKRGPILTENGLLPGALRYHNYKFEFNLRGDDGAHTGGLAMDSNLGWKGAEQYVATRAADLRPVGRPTGTLRPVHELHRAHLPREKWGSDCNVGTHWRSFPES